MNKEILLDCIKYPGQNKPCTHFCPIRTKLHRLNMRQALQDQGTLPSPDEVNPEDLALSDETYMNVMKRYCQRK